MTEYDGPHIQRAGCACTFCRDSFVKFADGMVGAIRDWNLIAQRLMRLEWLAVQHGWCSQEELDANNAELKRTADEALAQYALKWTQIRTHGGGSA